MARAEVGAASVPLVAAAGVCFGLIVLLVSVLAASGSLLGSTPWITKAQWEMYKDVAKNLSAGADSANRPIASVGLRRDPRLLVALHAVLLRQDFSQVTRAQIEDLAKHLVDFRSQVQTFEGFLARAGDQRTHEFAAARWQGQDHTDLQMKTVPFLRTVAGHVTATLDCWGPVCDVEVKALSNAASYTVEVEVATWDLRGFEAVADSLGLSQDDRAMVLAVAQFDPERVVR